MIDFVLVEQRSARLPVTQEIVGSNPIGDAFGGRVGAVRKQAKRPSSNLGVCGFDSLLRYGNDRSRRLGIDEPNCL